jgi:outer membrane protein assembly factor BamB
MNTSPVIGDGTVFVPGSGDPGVIHAVDIESGDKRWEFEPAGYASSAPALIDDTLYVGTWGKQFYAIDIATGETRWRQEIGHRFGSSSPAVADGTVYVAASSRRVCHGAGGDGESECSGVTRGQLYALDAATGDRDWTAPIKTDTRSSPAVADGVIYVGCRNGISAVTTAGENAWRVSFESTREDPSYVKSSPAVADGHVFIGASDGRLRAIRSATTA